MKKIALIIIPIIILIVLFFPCLFVRDMSSYVLIKPLVNTVNLKISYIHSVQKTPVEEYLEVGMYGKIKLYETRYQSFGVGMPFLESEGDFHQEGDFYVMDMEREFNDLVLRVGKDTNLTLDANGEVFPLYKTLPAGARVEIYTKPFVIGRFFK